jgi:hypothetical protein
VIIADMRSPTMPLKYAAAVGCAFDLNF